VQDADRRGDTAGIERRLRTHGDDLGARIDSRPDPPVICNSPVVNPAPCSGEQYPGSRSMISALYRTRSTLQEAGMSESPTRVSDDLYRYVAAHTVEEDAFLSDLKEAARAAGIPAIWIAPEQASCMQIVLRLARARDVVEVGTLAGYSAIAMARALPPEGRVHTIEIDPQRADFAERWIAKSDVAGRVIVHRGAGQDVLPTFASGSADAAFLDADKKGYRFYLDHCMRILRPGGLLMVDNAFAFGQLLDEAPTDSDVPAIRDFNDHLAALQGLQSIILPVGDGLWIAVRT
jgi:predicted O-methyltransferase YrrM